ncbi:MAG: hypothetical protein GJ680_06930 [Alteromonadaceae bacterium]|nr:hypothetical protein [Alteromonadaceae bacterium]
MHDLSSLIQRTTKRFTTLCFLSMCFLLTSSLQAQEQLQASITEFATQQNLTEEQVEAMTQTLSAGIKQRDRTLKKYGISMKNNRKARLNFQKKVALQNDMKALQRELQRDLSNILSEKQLEAWQLAQQTNQEEFRAKLKAKIG